MTVEEKVALLAGKDSWTTAAIARLGIPSIKVSDGPNGARGGGAFVGGVSAAAFPVAISLSSSWNVELVGEIAAALAAEAKSKGARVLLAPTVNMHRSTRNGRNFECYSEDPRLTSELAVAYIEGLQRQGVAATVKHFIGNESEYERHTISSDIDERALREIYMPPFEAAVKRAGTWALMTSYNRLEGTYVSERAELVNGVLKREWGFDGVAMSDWFGTQSTVEALAGGLDLEMPGPPRHRGDKLLAACRDGRVDPAALREAALRMLRLIDRVGAFANPTIAPERADDRPEVRALIRRAGAEGVVLLKNDGALPLAPKPGATLAVIGPNARTAQIMGGGSAQLNPHYRVAPLEALRAALPDTVSLPYELGAVNHRLDALYEGEVEIEYFHGRAFEGAPVHSARGGEGIFMFFGLATPGFAPTDFSARMRSTFVAPASGDYEFGLVASGSARLLIDGEVVIDAWAFKPGKEYFNSACDEARGVRALQAGRAYEIVVEYAALPAMPGLGVTVLRLGMSLVLDDAAIARAVAIAKTADAALLFVGLTGEWDGEGMDRPDIDLPHRQNELVARVAAVNRNTIVVLQSGSPVTMPWLAEVAAVLQAWYPGQEAGNCIADVLLGKAEPGGRLPQTWPLRLEDDPTFINYPGERGHVRYGEGVFIGYRYYEKKKIAPLFPFGYGLSYTRFEAGALTLSADSLAPGGTLTASINITNVGERAGSTVVQFYLADEVASVARPIKELAGFVRLRLAPGETRRASVNIDMRALAFFDVAAKAWMAEAGGFTVLAGFSSADIASRARFTLTHTWIDDSPRRSAL
ncbi:MAG: glycoside hydrolase family 3 C-terminal domain-containing protein [Pseudomonadota bacterium]|nr:glycoside hydrolase family 3 C-terminal domain-containing protein [Pseudomonadota bacterium]